MTVIDTTIRVSRTETSLWIQGQHNNFQLSLDADEYGDRVLIERTRYTAPEKSYTCGTDDELIELLSTIIHEREDECCED